MMLQPILSDSWEPGKETGDLDAMAEGVREFLERSSF